MSFFLAAKRSFECSLLSIIHVLYIWLSPFLPGSVLALESQSKGQRGSVVVRSPLFLYPLRNAPCMVRVQKFCIPAGSPSESLDGAPVHTSFIWISEEIMLRAFFIRHSFIFPANVFHSHLSTQATKDAAISVALHTDKSFRRVLWGFDQQRQEGHVINMPTSFLIKCQGKIETSWLIGCLYNMAQWYAFNPGLW